MEAAEQIRELTKLLEEANYQYYVLDDPKMEDYEYDRLMRQLEELETRHPELASPLSPTKRVGGQAISQFEKVEHPVPLESLQDVFSMEELGEFEARVREAAPDGAYTVEPRWTACLWRWSIWMGSSFGAPPGGTDGSGRTSQKT